MIIEGINTKNFRAFDKTDLKFSKLNLFFGPNNSGKSSILSVLKLLSQTLRSPDKKIPLLLTDSLVNLGTYKNMVFNNDIEKDIEIRLDFFYHNTRKRKERTKIELVYSFDKKAQEIILNSCKISGRDNFYIKYNWKKKEHELLNFCCEGKKLKGTEKMKRDFKLYNFLPIIFFRDEKRKRGRIIDTFQINNVLEKIEFIGPFRSPPQRIYLSSGEVPSGVGIRGDKAVDLLIRYNKNNPKFVDKISAWYKNAGIASEIKIKEMKDQYFKIMFKHKISDENENFEDVGFGCSQVLPILVAGYGLKGNRILVIEEPEIHLHPKAQAELGDFLKDIVLNGVQTFVETHSEHILLRVQSHVAHGKLKSEDVKVFYVYANRQGRKEIVPMSLDNNGFFKEKWPEGFFPERLEEAERVAKASIKK